MNFQKFYIWIPGMQRAPSFLSHLSVADIIQVDQTNWFMISSNNEWNSLSSLTLKYFQFTECEEGHSKNYCGEWSGPLVMDGLSANADQLLPHTNTRLSVPRTNTCLSVPRTNTCLSVPRTNTCLSVPRTNTCLSVPRTNTCLSVPRTNTCLSVPRTNINQYLAEIDNWAMD